MNRETLIKGNAKCFPLFFLQTEATPPLTYYEQICQKQNNNDELGAFRIKKLYKAVNEQKL